MTNREDPHRELDAVLTTAVAAATGQPDAGPRPGQSALAHDLLDAMLGAPGGEAQWTRGQAACVAPTGVGKSISALAPAMLVAARRSERTVVSTESLTLQAQYADKDAPVVAEAVREVTGVGISTAVLKGWGNYVCLLKAAGTAGKVVGDPPDSAGPSDLERLAGRASTALGEPVVVLTKSGRVSRSKRALERAARDSRYRLDTGTVERAELGSLLGWALSQTGPDDPGDRHSFDGATPGPAWEAVSCAPDECVGTDRCPFADLCRAERARRAAGEADLVITNHAMLAVQAATGAPVVLGRRSLGTFRHLVVDEAHGLPAAVRSQGGQEVSGPVLHRAGKAVLRVLGPEPGGTEGPAVAAWREAGTVLAGRVEDAVDAALRSASHHGGSGRPVAKLEPGSSPLTQLSSSLDEWVRAARRMLPSREIGPDRFGPATVQRVKRAHAALDRLTDAAAHCASPAPGWAVWVEQGQTGVSALRASPVDVSGLLADRLWHAGVLPDGSGNPDEYDASYDDGPDLPGLRPGANQTVWAVPAHEWSRAPDPATRTPPRYAMSVTCLSATLGSSFTFEAGLSVRAREYASPFDAAYGSSLFFAPKARESDLPELTSARYGKPRFDTGMHTVWAGGLVVEMVRANAGSALVLAATVSAGKAYAEQLRQRTGLTVHSQWDGPPVRTLIGRWKADTGSVMVGTRSLMTGVDAAGATCSLVVVDRVPRSAGNPVDDARVDAVVARTACSRWDADRRVYAADAALLLEQAAGRLVRSVTDSGLVACLDPRLVRTSDPPARYQEATRRTLMEAFRRFERKTADFDVALGFLAAQAGSRTDHAA